MDIRKSSAKINPLLGLIDQQDEAKIRNVEIHKDAEGKFHLYMSLQDEPEALEDDQDNKDDKGEKDDKHSDDKKKKH